MLQKVLTFANYAAAVLVCKIMLFCSNYAKHYASTIRQGLVALGENGKRGGKSLQSRMKCVFSEPQIGYSNSSPLSKKKNTYI